MIKSQEQDEFIAVRVQDPRVQNEGSWNSYVDFKIFLHTNSKAFTAKTSCVRRRYSEFVWLKKKLQKNAGLVPVPDLPKKSVFSFINDDFMERRRKGLQSFLDKVVHMTVCLSDSQLHLFLQTQLPVKHIEDCVQGHTPYTVTEAILNYASSNRGWVQEEGGGDQETGPAPVSYESVESPAPHLPSLQSPGATSSGAPNELSDVSDSESRLSDAEPTAPNLKLGTVHEQLPQEEESSAKLAVDVHPNHDDSVETEEKGLNIGSKNIANDLPKYDCVVAPQIDGLHEDTPLPTDKCSEDKLDQETISSEDVADNTVDKVIESSDFTEVKERSQEYDNAVRQTLDEDLHEENSRVRIENNEETPDEEDSDEHHTENDLETAEDTALHDACEKNITDNEDEDKAEKTEDHAVHQNGVSYEDSSRDVALQEEALDEKEEVKELKAKCFHPSNGILILDGIEEAVSTRTALMTETISNLDANTADVDTLVFEAIDIDSLQRQETDSHIIITTQQPDVC